MAHPQAPPRSSPTVSPAGPHGPGGPMGPRKPTTPGHAAPYPPPPAGEQPAPQAEPPPEHTYPCGCAWPGTHKQDCMWSLWEQMRDNYLKTRELMGKFMTQANTMQEAARKGVKCECPAGCHGTDLGAAMGLQQMTGVTLPWGAALGTPYPAGGTAQPPPPQQTYTVENEARRLMEEQKRIKNTWVQFLSIFDMALDMANDVSKDRWVQNRRRKERQRLEREQRLEEMRKERLERQKGSKPEPPPEKDKTAAGQETGAKDKEKDKEKGKEKETDKEKGKEKETDNGKDKADATKDQKPTTPADAAKDDKKEEEQKPAEPEEKPAEEEQPVAEAKGEEEGEE